jgi:(2S)-methylsuccinyl-CoA dehydrogenase
MNIAWSATPSETVDLTGVLSAAEAVTVAGETLLAEAKRVIRDRVYRADVPDAALLDRHQTEVHGLAWLATYQQSIAQAAAYGKALEAEGRLTDTERLLIGIGVYEYAAQILGGLPMSQTEFVRLDQLGVPQAAMRNYYMALTASGLGRFGASAAKEKLASVLLTLGDGDLAGDDGLDETLTAMRGEMQRFVQAEVAPHAHEWHLQNVYIPLSVVAKMTELGIFGLTIPEEFGGLGLGKDAMCVVSEELSRGYIGVGSLGTRTEIAAELILCGGTDEQKRHWLPRLADGSVLPTAVFTEPNTGSDLASLKTRAVLEGDTYRITGQKTWITHPVRADLMTVLARTNPSEAGYRGLSMFLAEKPRGTDENPFPAAGMTGGEIEVLGYRGMKEYEIAFDGFAVPKGALLGGQEGQGFKQLMQTFESARIQTAARAVGVAQSAMDLALRYAKERVQFGKPLIAFPRVSGKIVMMAVEILFARQLTYFAAREKDQGRRCDLEAGMAKLLAARVAWSAADNALQIHGGNGFALEYPISRVLCDARILSIFEGAAEIQAQVIARRLLETAA